MMTTDPSPKVILITGTSTGIGFTTALTFAAAPCKRYKVYATMRNMDERKTDLEKAAGDLFNTSLIIKELDVGNEASMVKCVEEILEEEKRIDVLINNAMVSRLQTFEELNLSEDGMQIFQINYFGPLRLMQLVIPGMKARRSGKILNISSIATLLPLPLMDMYASSKCALEATSTSVALTMRPYNVWVSVLQFGAVWTPRLRQLIDVVKNDTFNLLNPDSVKDKETKQVEEKFKKTLTELFEHETSQTSKEVSKFIMETSEVDKPLLYYQSSDFVRKFAAETYVEPTGGKKVKLYEAGIISLAT